MSELEKKWWFVLVVSFFTTASTIGLLYIAGFPPFEYSAAQWAVWFLCFMGLQRCFSFLGWLVVLAIAPKKIAVERT